MFYMTIYTQVNLLLYVSYTFCIIIKLFYICACMHKKVCRKIRQSIIKIFIPRWWEFEWFIFNPVSVGIPLVFSKFCPRNLYDLHNNTKLFVWRLDSEETGKKSSWESSQCRKCLIPKGLRPQAGGSRAAASEKRGRLCPLLSASGKWSSTCGGRRWPSRRSRLPPRQPETAPHPHPRPRAQKPRTLPGLFHWSQAVK